MPSPYRGVWKLSSAATFPHSQARAIDWLYCKLPFIILPRKNEQEHKGSGYLYQFVLKVSIFENFISVARTIFCFDIVFKDIII